MWTVIAIIIHISVVVKSISTANVEMTPAGTPGKAAKESAMGPGTSPNRFNRDTGSEVERFVILFF